MHHSGISSITPRFMSADKWFTKCCSSLSFDTNTA